MVNPEHTRETRRVKTPKRPAPSTNKTVDASKPADATSLG
jgi:hypothetical protein